MSKKVLLFLEYKFRDFTDTELREPQATGVMAVFEKLNKDRVEQIRSLGFEFGISLRSLPGGNICPASLEARKILQDKTRGALSLKPDVLWFDHLRFEGHWEKGKKDLSGIHEDCRCCRGKGRTAAIFSLAQETLKFIPRRIKTGYFAVPFKKDSWPDWKEALGQDHKRLGEIFDYVSPMIYHRMFGRPAGYIGEYIKHLSRLSTKAEIIPIIQIKDMPDDLPDKLSIEEISQEVKQALTPPSLGVAIFSWDQAIEKNKLESVSRILRKVS